MTAGPDPSDGPEALPRRRMALPHFPVELAPPDITPWLAGNTGVAGFTSFAGPAPGPHVMLVALTHGNELAGAIVLDQLLRAGPHPRCGRLTLGFANLAAFARFDRDQPTASRFVEEDMNRLWDAASLDGSRRSVELDRARAMRDLVESADVLMDLHSMLWPSEPLILSGSTARGQALAGAVGAPALVVADRGHLSGRRMIDYGNFADPDATATAVLVEAGQHWQPSTVATTQASVTGLLRHLGMIEGGPVESTARFAEVTHVVTAATASFAFVRSFHGGEVVPHENTVIAVDGDAEIRTPYNDCLLVMPSLRPSRGHTAVRLARFG